MPSDTSAPGKFNSRRQFLADALKTACAAGLMGAGLSLYAKQSKALPPLAIRPPGALAETDFQGACIRCGLCVRDCPYNILELAKPEQTVATGTPFFVARSLPCEMCVDIPCVKACPTGALDHHLTDIAKAKMGLAVLIDHETCLNFLGLRCDVCYRVCPLMGKAITLERIHNPRTDRHTMFLPTVHSDACTGCGKCEKGCVLDEAAIKVYPISIAKGKLGQHYRLGWEEKDKAGKSLVAPDAQHEYNLPEGYRYEQGRGLIPGSGESGPPGAQPGIPKASQGDKL